MRILTFILLLIGLNLEAQVRTVSVNTNGVLVAPLNFFAANSNLLNASVSGGGVSGSGDVTQLQLNTASNFVYGFAGGVGLNGTNFTLATGLNGTNFARGTIGLALTNLAFALGLNSSNYTDSKISALGTAITNFSLGLGLNNTNFALAIGTAGTNLSLAIGAAGTNNANTIGANGTNYVNSQLNSLGTAILNFTTDQFTLVNGTNIFIKTGAQLTNITGFGMLTNNGDVMIGGTNMLGWSARNNIWQYTNSPNWQGGIRIGVYGSSGAPGTNTVGAPFSQNGNNKGAWLGLAGGPSTGNSDGGGIIFFIGTNGASGAQRNGLVPRWAIGADGNLYSLNTNIFYPSNVISMVTDPVLAQDAATKNYADSISNLLYAWSGSVGTGATNRANAVGTDSTNNLTQFLLGKVDYTNGIAKALKISSIGSTGAVLRLTDSATEWYIVNTNNFFQVWRSGDSAPIFYLSNNTVCFGNGSYVVLPTTVTASRALVSTSSGYLSVASTTDTEINYVSGARSNIFNYLDFLSTVKPNGTNGFVNTITNFGTEYFGTNGLTSIYQGGSNSLILQAGPSAAKITLNTNNITLNTNVTLGGSIAGNGYLLTNVLTVVSNSTTLSTNVPTLAFWNFTMTNGAGGRIDIVAPTSSGGGGGETQAQFIVLVLTNSTLPNARKITGTANQISLADGGNGGNLTLSLPQNIDTAAAVQHARLGLGLAADPVWGLLVSGGGSFTNSTTGSFITFSNGVATFSSTNGSNSVVEGFIMTNSTPALTNTPQRSQYIAQYGNAWSNGANYVVEFQQGVVPINSVGATAPTAAWILQYKNPSGVVVTNLSVTSGGSLSASTLTANNGSVQAAGSLQMGSGANSIAGTVSGKVLVQNNSGGDLNSFHLGNDKSTNLLLQISSGSQPLLRLRDGTTNAWADLALGSISASTNLVATNGFASYSTNTVLGANAAGWTNTSAINMIVNIAGTSGNIVFWNRSGAGGQTSCGQAIWTNSIIANGEDFWVGVNCGVQITSGVGIVPLVVRAP